MSLSTSNLTVRDIPFVSNSKGDDRFTRVGEGHYVLTSSDLLNTDLEVRHVRRERHQLHGELTVRSGLPGIHTFNGIVFTASINLSSLRERDSVASALSARARTPAADSATWKGLIDELSIRVQAAEVDGDPSVLLCDVKPKSAADRWLKTLGFTLPEKLPAMIFGDGDSLKTYTADAIAVDLAKQGIGVGVVDGEMIEDDHAERARRISPIVPANIAYLSCSRPQNFSFMTAPCYLLEGLLKARRVAHNGHPILRWNVSNVAVKGDEAGRLRPVKP